MGTVDAAAESRLEMMVEAALAGHDIGPFEPADATTGGYEAACRRCGRSVWVGDDGLIYSLLAERCPGAT
jgi:hypothetical protein